MRAKNEIVTLATLKHGLGLVASLTALAVALAVWRVEYGHISVPSDNASFMAERLRTWLPTAVPVILVLNAAPLLLMIGEKQSRSLRVVRLMALIVSSFSLLIGVYAVLLMPVNAGYNRQTGEQVPFEKYFFVSYD